MTTQQENLMYTRFRQVSEVFFDEAERKVAIKAELQELISLKAIRLDSPLEEAVNEIHDRLWKS